MSDEAQPPNAGEDENEFVIDFIKSQFFRVVFAEGFWGGTTIEDKIHIAFWNSRDAIPQKVIYKFDEKGDVIDMNQVVRADQIRELEVGVIMGVDTAKVLRNFLDEIIANVEVAESEVGSESGTEDEPSA